MPALHMPGDVKNVKFVDIVADNRTIGIWTVTLRSASDTMSVPGLASTSGVGSMTSGISVSAASISEGENVLTITGGSLGDEASFATLHRVGMSNNLSIDEAPAE
jgi:hypothetical protein